MQKKITQQNFKVFLLKTMLPLFVLTFAFQALTAQKLAEQARGVKQQPQPVSVVKTTEKKALTKEMVKAENSKLALQAQAAEKSLSDNPAFNATYTGKEASFETPASITAACLFTGALITGDLTMAQRLNRPGAPGGTCAVPRVFPGTFGTGPYFYGNTFLPTTGVAACVVVNLTTTRSYQCQHSICSLLGSLTLRLWEPITLPTLMLVRVRRAPPLELPILLTLPTVLQP
ncbi:MAG: hypothetical protein IPI54_02585 [Chitinophagaceae bacterium]|nr:hypothetical protein [Chitinophagaceae bacterium]